MKPLKFAGSSEDDLAAFPKEAKGLAGNELWQVQLGLMPSDWKPMLNVGAGAYGIRVHVLGEWRVIYVAKFADTAYTLKGTRTCEQVYCMPSRRKPSRHAIKTSRLRQRFPRPRFLAGRSRPSTRHLTIARLRSDTLQVREIQPRHADYTGDQSGKES